uniref:Putative membrane protein n=1 Tax=wastewater metagenome TaxID=527639 RepID=A0A0A8KXS4_9ZZZZ
MGRKISDNSRVVGGYTLVEMLVALLVSSVLLTCILGSYIQTSEYYRDQQIKAQVDEKARVLLDMLAFDIRMMGAGIPFYQKNFRVGGVGLSDMPQPILTESTATRIVMRLNQEGAETVLIDQFDPNFTFTMRVLSTENIRWGDLIYISNVSTGEYDGFGGTVVDISGDQVTVQPGFAASAGAVFKAGSVVHVVSPVIYEAWGDWVNRSDNRGQWAWMDKASFSLDYLAEDGVQIVLPMTVDDILNSLGRIRITATATSETPLSTGELYVGTARQEVMLRNLLISRTWLR